VRATLIALMVAGSAVAVTACDRGGSKGQSQGETSSAASTTAESVQIESSLEGLPILPPRIPWTVTTSLPAEEIREVRFLLDGERLWKDPNPPFAYGEEGAQLGTWMGPGRHRFTVRVIATDGSRTSETVIARVRNTKTKHELWGVWERRSKESLETPPPPGESPHFTAALWFGQRVLWIGRSNEQAFAYEYWVKGNILHLGTAFFSGAPGDPRPVQGWGGAEGTQCGSGASPARYSLASKEFPGRSYRDFAGLGYIVLTVKQEPCAERGRLLAGVWEGFGT
jgi:hypothetical protein